MTLASIFQSGVSIQFYIVLSTLLFCIGAIGVLVRRNAIILLMCIELMLNAVNLLMVAFSTYFGKADGQIFVFFIMVVAAAEATVGLSILVMAYRNLRTTDCPATCRCIDKWYNRQRSSKSSRRCNCYECNVYCLCLCANSFQFCA